MKIKTNDQRSLYDQLKTLVPIANKYGLYDASDYLKRICKDIERRTKGQKIKVISGGKNQAEQISLFEIGATNES